MSRVRRAILARPGLEPLVFVALLCLYIWTLEPVASGPGRVLGAAVLLALPVCSNLLHRDRPRDLGLRLDNLLHSSREVGGVTLIGTVLIVAGSLAFGWRPALTLGGVIGPIAYLVWGFAQQYALQAFVQRRLRESLQSSQRAAVVSALLFGIVHLPNPLLVVSTAVAGYLWCRAFERSPNLVTLAVSHALLAGLLMSSVPREIHHVMRVGPGYWR